MIMSNGIDLDKMWDLEDEAEKKDTAFKEEQSKIAEGESTEIAEDAENSEEEQEENNEDLDILARFGIENNKILMEDDNGNEVEVDFNSLSEKEKLNIVAELAAEYGVENNLTDDEITLIDFLRQNNMTLDELVKQEALRLVSSIDGSNYASMSDEEIYLLFLKDTTDLSEDEMKELLENNKNHSSFAKLANKYREQYIAKEQVIKEQEAQQATLAEQQEMEELKTTVISAAQKLDSINGFELDDEIKEELLVDILDKDADGQSNFSKLINQPENLIKAAWYLKHADEVFEGLKSYFKKEVSRAYNKGKEEAINGLPANPIETGGSTNKKSSTSNSDRNVTTLEDMWKNYK